MLAFGRPSAGDLIAGVSVALVAIPQSLAYAELAGVPAELGLAAVALPALVAAWFVSSKDLQTGPVALTALLTFGALQPLALPGSAEYVELAGLLALMVGVIRLVLGVAKMGWISDVLTRPMLIGFSTAAALLILASQLPKVFDVEPPGDGVVRDAVWALGHPDAWSWAAIAIAAGTLALMIGGRRMHRAFPGVVIAAVTTIVISEVADYDGSIVGELGGGFVSLSFGFEWSGFGSLIVPALVIGVVGFAEPTAIARTFARRDESAWSPNRELVSQGVANVVAAVSGAFPVGGSFSRSALSRLAGATTRWAGAITGAVVLVLMPFSGVLEPLPEATLGAIVIGSVLGLIDVSGFRELARTSRTELAVAGITLIATLVSSPRIERGVIVGVAASLVARYGGGWVARVRR